MAFSVSQRVTITNQDNQVMDLWHFESTFLIFAVGMILSFLVFLLEKFTK